MFGRHVRGGPDDHTRKSKPGFLLSDASQAEISDAGLACFIEKDISGFKIAVEHTPLMSEGNGLRDLAEDLGGTSGRHGFALECGSERSTREKGHRQKVLGFVNTAFENGHDTRMNQRGSSASFNMETVNGIVVGECAAGQKF
ncbi:MAG: hypothetical protein L0Z50_20410 [Verrucomicrobiales bacterium]|nr:hypothetical protein [Verrucomicrobiales bacterium]